MRTVQVFGWGLLISLLGSLPLGSLNVMAWRIYHDSTLSNAIVFSLGVALVEVVYVRISLVAMKWVLANKRLFRVLEWITVVLFLGLAAYTFFAATKATQAAAFYVKENLFTQFLYGIGLCAINPVQIPFWFLWSIYLITRGKLQPLPVQYNSYCLGIGIGTLIGEGLYIYGGEYLVTTIGANAKSIQYFVGGVFCVTALIQLYGLLLGKSKLDNKKLEEGLDKL